MLIISFLMFLQGLLGLAIVLAVAIAYKYYFKPKAEIKRYAALFKSLGYIVYEYPFSFMGISFADAQKMGVKLHKDAQYLQKTVLPQVDVAISNCVQKVTIFIVNPDLMKAFLNGNTPYKYPKLETMISGIKTVLGQGMVFSQGESWKKKRKLMSKVFNFDLFKEKIPTIVQICNHFFDKVDRNNSIDESNKVIFNLRSFSSTIFNSVIVKCFFGHDYNNEMVGGMPYGEFVLDTIQKASDLTLDPLIAFLGKFAWKIGVTSQIRSLNQRVALMRQKALKIVKERTDQAINSPTKEKCSNIIQALIYEKLENKEEFSYSDSEFIDEFQTFLIAGTDTTTRFFTMMVFSLGNHPQIHKRVREEVNAIIKSDQDITYENLKKLTYIDWIQFETTRMYGPVNGMLFRIAEEDNYLNDVLIGKGTMVTTQPLGNHFNTKYFKQPQVFRPERWESECDGIHPFAFNGFSAGIRSCIGKQLAHLQSKIALVKLIKRYQTIEVPKEVTMILKFMYEPEPFDATFTKVSANL